MPKKRGNGDGALFKLRGRNLWRGAVSLGYDETGRRILKYVHAKTERECRRKLRELQAEVAEHGAPLDKRSTLAEFARQWVADYAASGDVGPKEVRDKKRFVEAIIAVLGEKKTIATVRPSDMLAIRTAQRQAGLSISTQRKAQVALSQIMDAAVAERLVATNPIKAMAQPGARAEQMRQREAAVVGERGALTVDEVTAILAAASRLPDATGARWWVKIVTGARQGEILGSRLDGLDLNAGTWTVAWQMQHLPSRHGCAPAGAEPTCGRAKPRLCPDTTWDVDPDFEREHITGTMHWVRPKSAAGLRVVPLVPPVVEAVRRHLDAVDWPNPHGLVWRNSDGSPIRDKQDNAEWKALLADAGVPLVVDGKIRTGHWARHTAVTVLASMGVPLETVGELVGHSSAQVTAIYRHTTDTERARALKQLTTAWSDVLTLPR